MVLVHHGRFNNKTTEQAQQVKLKTNKTKQHEMRSAKPKVNDSDRKVLKNKVL